MKYGSGCNHTTNMKVVSHREEKGGDICVEFEVPPPKAKSSKSKDGFPTPMPFPSSRCTIVMPKDEAAHYPVGGYAAIHCVPGKDKDAASEGKERLVPKGLRGKMAMASEASAKARKDYREEEAEED